MKAVLITIGVALTLNILAEKTVSLDYPGARVEVKPKGFRFRFVNPENGSVYAPFHERAGLLIDGEAGTIADATEGESSFIATTASGTRAKVAIASSDGVVTVKVEPKDNKAHTVELRLGPIPVAHGLGDTGGFNETFNLVGPRQKIFKIINNGGSHRWASSFVICPRNRIAGVYLGSDTHQADLGPDGYGMSVRKQGAVTFQYFLGDMQTIYKRYLDVRLAAGYPNIKPKFRLFELGWESWPSLGWQTNSEAVRKALQRLLDEGFPVRWAVTGSGFWKKGGATTDFGEFGAGFQDAAGFRAWCHENNVKWMIGLRTNFIPSGGPFVPKSERRDRNLKTDRYVGNPSSAALLSKGYFWTVNGTPMKVTSRWFPQVPSYLLDGRKPEAASWYAEQYKRWGVDGIKEDTMMEANIDIFNGPVSKISEQGGLVMARCGSFSAPGTLLRINDTGGAKDMAKRIPINYLQNAACGAPNAYSDTIGYKDNPESLANLRHGWLLACTAGMAVGPFNWKEPKMRKAFKRLIQFHYEIAPSMYDAAMKSYETGFPYTMTPLDIAFPEDADAALTPTFQWMIGESLLAVPLVKNIETNRVDVYLPKGIWYDYDSGQKHQGPTTLKGYPMGLDKVPCFVGGKGIVIRRNSDNGPLTAKVYSIGKRREPFRFTYPDGSSKSTITITKSTDAPTVKDLSTNQDVSFSVCPNSGAVSFDLTPCHSYRVALGNNQ